MSIENWECASVFFAILSGTKAQYTNFLCMKITDVDVKYPSI